MRHQFSLFPMAFLFHFDIFLFFKLFYSDSRHYSCNQSQILSRFKSSQNTSIYGQKCQISSANPPFSLVHSVHQSDVIFETSSISDLEMIRSNDAISNAKRSWRHENLQSVHLLHIQI